MKQLIQSLMLVCVFALTSPGRAESATIANAGSLSVVSYNLRFLNPNEKPEDQWPKRRLLMVELLRQLAPDVMGTQEGVYQQLKDLAAELPELDWIGLGRDGGSRGEFMAVFYRKTRLEPLAYDHFWLSDTPLVMGSTTWGNDNRRMVTWVKFRDRVTGGEFYFWNTHFDHRIQEAREKSAALVRERIAKLDTKSPVLLVGDFNANAEKNKAYQILTGEKFLTDAWLVAKERHGEGIGTFNNFQGPVPDGARIDWILYRGDVQVERIETVTFGRNGRFPSDHFPVAAKLRLPALKQ